MTHLLCLAEEEVVEMRVGILDRLKVEAMVETSYLPRCRRASSGVCVCLQALWEPLTLITDWTLSHLGLSQLGKTPVPTRGQVALREKE